jgi:hypothetical protein
MCRGTVTKGKPYTAINVVFPAYYLKHKAFPPLLDFLVDTGAQTTIVNSIDATKFGILYREEDAKKFGIEDGDKIEVPCFEGENLEYAGYATGIGGVIHIFKLNDVLLIQRTKMGAYQEYHTEFLDYILIPEGKATEIPNLLGRDVINRFKMLYDATNNIFEFTRVPRLGCGYAIHIE